MHYDTMRPPHLPTETYSPPHLPTETYSPPHLPTETYSPPHLPTETNSPPDTPLIVQQLLRMWRWFTQASSKQYTLAALAGPVPSNILKNSALSTVIILRSISGVLPVTAFCALLLCGFQNLNILATLLFRRSVLRTDRFSRSIKSKILRRNT